MENLNWLFGAYGIGWLLVFGYMFRISRKERSLRKRISELEELIEERWKRKGS